MPTVERRASTLAQQSADHDVLIRLDQKVDILTQDIKDIKENTVNRVDKLEATVTGWQELKVQREKVVADHETRIRRLEYAYAIAVGGLAIIELYVKYFHK